MILVSSLTLIQVVIGAELPPWTVKVGPAVEAPVGEATKVVGWSAAAIASVLRDIPIGDRRWRIGGAATHQWAVDPSPARSFSLTGAWLRAEYLALSRLSVGLMAGAVLRHVEIGSIDENATLAGLSVSAEVAVFRMGRFEVSPGVRYSLFHALNDETFFHQQAGAVLLGSARF